MGTYLLRKEPSQTYVRMMCQVPRLPSPPSGTVRAFLVLPAADSPSGYVENLVGTGALLKIDTDY